MSEDLRAREAACESASTSPRPNLLAFPGRGLANLRNALLGSAPLESACFLLARAVRAPSGAWRLIAYETIELAAADYSVRSATELQVAPSVVAEVMQRARVESASVVLVHSHPNGGPLMPSARDISGEGLLLPAFRRRVPGVPHARLILGPGGVHAALFTPDGNESALQVVEVGADVTFAPSSAGCEGASLAGMSGGQYDRQVRAFGDHGQRQLANLRVAIVGLGGTGSVAAQQIAYLGVGSFILIDPDTVEVTNLNRVIGAGRADVGRAKVDVASDMIVRINPDAVIETLRADVRDQRTARRILDADAFMLCTDSQGSRAVLSQLAYQYLLPGFDVGVAIHANAGTVSHVSGRVQMLAPGLPCLLCCAILDPEVVRRDLLTEQARAADSYIVGAPAPEPAVVSINGAASSLAVTMLLSAITGVPYGTRNQRLRLETGTVSRIDVEARPECPICSTHGGFARGDSWPMPGRV